jgi:hypothetical protein
MGVGLAGAAEMVDISGDLVNLQAFEKIRANNHLRKYGRQVLA